MKQFSFSGIVGWDVLPADLRNFLNEAGGDDVEMIISSPGGYVGDALEMYNLVRNYPGKVTAVLSGFAMSAASYIPLAADEIVVEDNAVFMIHFVRGGVVGDHEDILKYGRDTEGLSRLLTTAYVRHTGMEFDAVWEMMRQETFFFGQEIVDAGFGHHMIEGDGIEDRENCLTIARTALGSCLQHMAASPQQAADDFAKAVAMAVEYIPPRAMAPEKSSKEAPMDLNTLKNEHPDLVAAISGEVIAGLTVEDLETANSQLAAQLAAQGAETERARIADVRAQLIPGHEQLIASMELDGTSTGADAAKAIVAAEKTMREQAAADLDEEANQAAVPAGPGEEGKKEMARKDFNAMSFASQRSFVQSGGVVRD